MNPIALDGGDRRQRAHLAQRLRRADRQVEPRGIGAIDDIDVVVARQDQHAFGEIGILGHDVEKLGPFGGDARVRHVAADEDEVERLRCVQGRQAIHRLDQAIVAARPGAPALDAETVALADDMDVGQMRDAPDASAVARAVEGLQIERLVAGGVGEAPEQCGDREIGGHDDDRVGEGRDHEGVRQS